VQTSTKALMSTRTLLWSRSLQVTAISISQDIFILNAPWGRPWRVQSGGDVEMKQYSFCPMLY